jgi:hypothetical protein
MNVNAWQSKIMKNYLIVKTDEEKREFKNLA